MLLIGFGLLSIVGCASNRTHDLTSRTIASSDKKVWTCAGLQRGEKNEPLTEAKDRLEIFKSGQKYKFAGYGEFERVNSTEGQGIFNLIVASDKDSEFREDGELYRNSNDDSLVIIQDSDMGPKAGTLHVQGSEYAVLCQPID